MTPSRSSLRVHAVSMHAFRGVPRSLTVAFLSANGAPQSAIIFGENGSGKSSIVDAIEWACQGKVGRARPRAASSVPRLINASSGARSCWTEAELSDGTSLTRHLEVDDTGTPTASGSPVPEALLGAPMSLKRADILRFLDSKDVGRGAVFVDHALDGGTPPVSQQLQAEQDAAAALRLPVRQRLSSAARELADLVGVVEVPRDPDGILRMISKEVYLGLRPKDWSRVTLSREVREAVGRVNGILDELRSLSLTGSTKSTAVTERVRRMHSILGDVNAWMTSAFQQVTGTDHVLGIRAEFGRLGVMSLEIEIELKNGTIATPREVFSEGYQDLVALLYFLAVSSAAGRRGQARVLILDDVLQSVDAAIRVDLMRLVIREFNDWQLIITVHDKLWRTQLRDIFQRAGHPVCEIDIRRWRFDDGPHIAAAPSGSSESAALWRALEAGDAATVCGVAGRLLEQVADRLSWTIPTSVKRKRGDQYTLADLWPGAVKELKNTTAGPALLAADQWLHLRNAAGAHYNEWAESLTWSDAERFGLAALEVLDSVLCQRCGGWVDRTGSKRFACRCGSTVIEPAA